MPNTHIQSTLSYMFAQRTPDSSFIDLELFFSPICVGGVFASSHIKHAPIMCMREQYAG